MVTGSIAYVEFGGNVVFELTCKMFSKSINWYKEIHRVA